MDKPVYLDYNATTPVDKRVLDEMIPYFNAKFGNAASRNHPFGWAAQDGIEEARENIADLINSSAKEIIFTSGATESDNLALKGVFEMYANKGNHIITVNTEHKAILDACDKIERLGGRVTYLQPAENGLITAKQVEDAITDKTILVSVMYGNNEVGVIQPIQEISKLCKSKNILFHTDATQAVGKIPVDVIADGIDLMSFSAHKMYGPKGVGALYVRRKRPRVKVTAQIDGGGHERGMRSGTLNVPSIVGFGAAAKLAKQDMDTEAKRLSILRNKLEKGLMKIEETYINGSEEHRLPHVTNISFKYVEGEGLMIGAKDVAVSSGSACTSASLEPSYVLKNLGLDDELAHSSLRFSLGKYTTEADIDFAIDHVTKAVNKLRDMSPLWEMHKEGIDLKTIEWSAH